MSRLGWRLKEKEWNWFSERERNRLRAQKALASGKAREAEQFFQKAIEITPEMVLNVIRVRFSHFPLEINWFL